MTMFGTTAILAAVITMSLPESKNVKLPDTIHEAELIGSDVKPDGGNTAVGISP